MLRLRFAETVSLSGVQRGKQKNGGVGVRHASLSRSGWDKKTTKICDDGEMMKIALTPMIPAMTHE